jgi:tetrahydromethanopterin S-methyltransferase subunit F
MLAVIYLSAGAGILIGTRRRGAAGLALGVLTAGALAVVLHGIPFE